MNGSDGTSMGAFQAMSWRKRLLFVRDARRQPRLDILPVLIATLRENRMAKPSATQGLFKLLGSSMMSWIFVVVLSLVALLIVAVIILVAGIAISLVAACVYALFGGDVQGEGFERITEIVASVLLLLVSLIAGGAALQTGTGNGRETRRRGSTSRGATGLARPVDA